MAGYWRLEESVLCVLMNSLDRVLYTEKKGGRRAETPVPSPGKRRGVTKVGLREAAPITVSSQPCSLALMGTID